MESKPFVGLRPFTAEESGVFFGRSEEVSILSNLIHVAPLLIVYAPSGTGKSSLLNAGLLPVIEKDAEFSVVYVADHGTDVVRAVSDRCNRELNAVGRFSPDDQTLVEMAETYFGETDTRVLLIIDQFEERLKQPGSMEELWRELGIVGNSRSDALTVVISLREDYLGSLEPLMQRVPALLDSRYRVPPLSVTALKQAVYGPLERCGIREGVSDELVETVLRDLTEGDSSTVRVEPGYFQVVWKRLWEIYEQGTPAFESTAAYQGEGHAPGIVKRFVDSRIESLLSPFETVVLGAAVRYLVLPTGAKVPLTVDDLAGLIRAEDFAGNMPVFRALNRSDLLTPVVRSVFSKLSRSETPLFRRAIRGDRIEFQLVHDLLGGVLLDWQRRQSSTEREEVVGEYFPPHSSDIPKRSQVHAMVAEIADFSVRLEVPLFEAGVQFVRTSRVAERSRMYDSVVKNVSRISSVQGHLPRSTRLLLKPLRRIDLPASRDAEEAASALREHVYPRHDLPVSESGEFQSALEELVTSAWIADDFLRDGPVYFNIPGSIDYVDWCRKTGLFVLYLALAVPGLVISRYLAGEIYTLPHVEYAPIPFVAFTILMALLYVTAYEDAKKEGLRSFFAVLACGRYGYFSWPIHYLAPMMASYLVASVVEALGPSPSAGFHAAAVISFFGSAIIYSSLKEV